MKGVSKLSAKNVDRHNRFRSITVGFRVSPEENEEIKRAVALSGLSKQEYCYRRCMERNVVVQGNPRVFKALRNQMTEILEELKRIERVSELSDECRFVNDVLQKRLKEFTEIDKRVDVVNGSFPIKRTHREFIVVTVMHL